MRIVLTLARVWVSAQVFLLVHPNLVTCAECIHPLWGCGCQPRYLYQYNPNLITCAECIHPLWGCGCQPKYFYQYNPNLLHSPNEFTQSRTYCNQTHILSINHENSVSQHEKHLKTICTISTPRKHIKKWGYENSPQ